jgi:hypothetical protein
MAGPTSFEPLRRYNAGFGQRPKPPLAGIKVLAFICSPALSLWWRASIRVRPGSSITTHERYDWFDLPPQPPAESHHNRCCCMTRGLFPLLSARLLALVLLATVVATGLANSPATVSAASQQPASSGAMTIYQLTNPNSVPLNVQNVISGPGAFTYSFWTIVPAQSSLTIHLRDVPQVPARFQGTLNVYASMPFYAAIVGYDYGGGRGPNEIYLPLVTR